MSVKELASVSIGRYSITIRKYDERTPIGIRRLKFGKFPWWQSRVAFDLPVISILFEYY